MSFLVFDDVETSSVLTLMQVEVRNVIIITTGKEEAQAAIFEVVDVYI